ncbi:hypothetical protein DMH02_009405 [Streptomyces sp. WAC 00631]|uniref:hypothetical protein n=1 Tax=Streptomyces sp. WAC 00631 TaxID=2203201 RepID=UPI000F769773|nr:hypothetical protein [Streptomyces sp. WAC 00631]MCC5033427.1 hypothetical protein [Streptomyces sp. WAC 00631]
MSWFPSPFLPQWALPAGLSGLVAWICLVRQYHGKGRLLGTRQSVLLSAAVVGAMAAIALLVIALLPLLSEVPAAAVGVATGAGVLRRGRAVQPDTTKPFLSFLTLGTAHLLERLEARMETDCADWCDDMVSGIRDPYQMQIFVHAVRLHLLARHPDKAGRKLTDERFAEAEAALQQAIETDARTGGACRAPGRDGLPEPRRDRGEAERVESLRAWGEALHSCKLLLRVAYLLGRRSDRRRLLELLDGAAPAGSRRDAPLPSQRRPHRRWFGRVRDGRGRRTAPGASEPRPDDATAQA